MFTTNLVLVNQLTYILTVSLYYFDVFGFNMKIIFISTEKTLQRHALNDQSFYNGSII